MVLPNAYLTTSDRQELYSMAYVQAIIGAAGFNYSRPILDRCSDDIYIEYPSNIEPYPNYPRLLLQVKCSYGQSINSDGFIHYSLPIKNYNDLRQGIEPKLLILVLVPRPENNEVEPWIEPTNNHTIFRYKAYWHSLLDADETDNRDSVTIHISANNILSVDSLKNIIQNMVVEGHRHHE